MKIQDYVSDAYHVFAEKQRAKNKGKKFFTAWQD
jgi:hypothetical protein